MKGIVATTLLSALLGFLPFMRVDCCAPAPAPSPPNPPPNPPAPPSNGPVKNVIWLGNSYTYFHDMPKMVQELARYDGKTINYRTHTPGGWTWQKHAASPTTNNLIRSQRWDVAILQEQSQTPVFGEGYVCANSIAPLKNLVSSIRAMNPGTIVQLYGTWGRPGQNEFASWQYWLTRRYKTFACMITKPSRMAPVGEGFKKMEELYGAQARIGLYEPNDHHSSVKGSYLAACMHFLAIYGEDANVVGNSYHGGLPSSTALQLQKVAQEVWNKGNEWIYSTDGDCNLSMC